VEEGVVVFANYGFCPICEAPARFVARGTYLRNHYLCETCGSEPRERALIHCLQRFFPDFRKAAIHESSPLGRGASTKLARECAHYVATQCFDDVPRGSSRDGIRSEDLERLTFADESLDLHVTQDVLEHVLDPDAAFREIARTLRPGGAHVFTVPLVRKERPSFVRAERLADGSIVHRAEPKYHANPIDPNGSLVTVDWGYDVCERIFRASGLVTKIVEIDDLERGIRAELNEVLISYKLSGGRR
jgi:SAM-dependent methyltransferase